MPRHAVWILALAGLAGAAPPEVPKARRLTSDADFKQHLHFAADGKRLLFTRIHKGKMGLWTVASDGGDSRPLLDPDPKTPHFDGHLSPDGKRLVYVFDVLKGTDGNLQINTADADGKNSKTLIPHKAFDESPRWSPDGKRIAWVSTRDGNQEIYTADASTGGDIRRLTNDVGFDNNPAWSPDGKKIAFASSRYGNFEICTMNADGSGVKRLTNDPASDMWPAWSPDGKRIAFTSNRDGNYEIYLMNADGTGPRNLTRNKGQDNFAAWTPDGKSIAFLSSRDGGQDVYTMEVK